MAATNPTRHDIFVSYSRQDADWAGAFVDMLKKRGWSVFLDTRAIKAGDEWSPEIDAAIDAAKVVIALWSARSVRSSYVTYEAARAVVRGTLVPLSIDRTRAPPAFRRFQAQPMHVAGAAALPLDLVTAIEKRLTAPPPAPTAEEQRLRTELAGMSALARDRGVPLVALQELLERLGEINVAPDAIPARLESFVSEFLTLKSDLARSTNADPDIAATQTRALKLLNAGDLDGARTLIDDALTRRREFQRQSARETATLLADRARIDMMQVRYPEAIAAYEEAADVVGFDKEAMAEQLVSMVDALIRQGEEFGDNVALTRAIDVLRTRTMRLVPRDRAPLDWARLQFLLGLALVTLGARESTAASLYQSVAAFQAALEEYTRDRTPLRWAAAQNNLGNAMQALAEHDSDTTSLEGAAAAFKAALEEYTRDRVPLQWAMTQCNIGNTLQLLGERERSILRLNEAISAYRAALLEYTRHRVPLDWALTLHNLGTALVTLGVEQNDKACLEEALAVFRAALEERVRDRVPLGWAMTQSGLGNALTVLGKWERSTARLEEGISAHRAALEENTRDRAPMEWAKSQNNLGVALLALGKLESGTERLEEAAAAFCAAQEERACASPRWIETQEQLEQTLSLLEERSSK